MCRSLRVCKSVALATTAMPRRAAACRTLSGRSRNASTIPRLNGSWMKRKWCSGPPSSAARAAIRGKARARPSCGSRPRSRRRTSGSSARPPVVPVARSAPEALVEFSPACRNRAAFRDCAGRRRRSYRRPDWRGCDRSGRPENPGAMECISPTTCSGFRNSGIAPGVRNPALVQTTISSRCNCRSAAPIQRSDRWLR